MSVLKYTPEGYPQGNKKFVEEANKTLERSRPGIERARKYFKESKTRFKQAVSSSPKGSAK